MRKKDRKLLYELDSDFRRPYSKISSKVKMSQQLISYKVNTFQSNRIITGFFPLVDYSRFNFISFMVHFKINYLNKRKYQDLIERLKRHKNITSILETDGKHDLVVIFSTNNPSSFNKMLKSLVSDNKEQLRSFMILTMIVEHFFKRNYLVNKKGNDDVVIGGDREKITIDDTNRRVIKALMEGKKGTVEISRVAKISPKTVFSRIRWLERKEIIKGYKVLFNPSKMKILTNTILIKFRSIPLEKEDGFKNYCIYNPNITRLVKTFGDWDSVLTIETDSRSDFRKLYLDIRERFEDVIEDIDNYQVFKVYKESTLPFEAFSCIENAQ